MPRIIIRQKPEVVCADAIAELYFDGELIDTLSIPSGDTDSFNIDCSTLLNAVRVESDEFSHQHTGTFILIGEENGKPKYEKDGDPDRVIRYNGTRWILEKLGGGAHTHDAAIGDEDFPWLANWDDAFLLVSQATIGTYCANGAYAYYQVVNSNGDVILTGSIPSGDTGVISLPDETINIVDENGDPIDTITFPVYTDPNIDITSYCPAGTPQAGRELMKTGQTTSYRTGDDGDLEEGRAVSFTTLDYTNPFGNTNRFTDELGGQTYTNNIVIDWSTYNNVTGKVLGWDRRDNGDGSNVNKTWNNSIDEALAHSVGTFTTGWRLPNVNEAGSICNHELANVINYAPFNKSVAFTYWLSTTRGTSGANAFYLFGVTTSLSSHIAAAAKTASAGYRWLAVRTFTVTGTTLT